MSLTEKVSLMRLFRIIKTKIIRFKLLSAFLAFLLLIVTPVSANEIIKLDIANKHLNQARDLKALEKPQEAQEALQQAKNKLHTTLLVKILKNEEVKQTEKEIKEMRQAVAVEMVGPQYSVVIKSTPTFDSYGFVTFETTIKNIAVMPYITNFGLYDCNFVDSKNNKYSGSFDTGIAFNQAIFPDKSQDFVVKDAGIGVSGLDNTTEGLKKCFYEDKGYKKCELVDDLTIVDCMGYVTSNGKQASNGWGENPIKITFPLPIQPNSPTLTLTPTPTPTPTPMPIPENKPSYVYDPYYPIILSLSDNKGGQIKYSEHNQYPYSSTNTGIILKVGDSIRWKAEVSDPKGRQISYSFTSNSQRFTDLFGREDGNCKYTTNDEAEFTITEEDLKEVGETLRIVLNIRSEKDNYRTGGECGYDDSTYLDYKIQPD
ncbi:MAG: hypothetical protein ABIG91_00520 [Patescibacteria group bacterium]